jgi:hypothetical protein
VDVQTDKYGNRYIELDRPLDQKTRLTYIPDRKWLEGRAVVRMQFQDADGHLHFGPEIPVDDLGELFQGIITLMSE